MSDRLNQALGPVGACLPVSFTSALDAAALGDAVGRLERAGVQGIWTNEVIGKDALVQLAMLLATTSRTVFGTCIANIWARPAQTMHAAARPTGAGLSGQAGPRPRGRLPRAGGQRRSRIRQTVGHDA
jgi:hypothetical protein